MLLFSDAISHSVTRNLDLTSFTGPVKAWVRLGEASPQWSLSVGSTFPSQPFYPWWSVVQPFLIVGFKIGLHGQTVDRCVHIMAWCLHCWVPQYLVRAVSKHHHIRKYYLRPPWLGCVLNSGCCLMTASGCQKPQISTKPKLTVVFTGIHWGCIIRILFFFSGAVGCAFTFLPFLYSAGGEADKGEPLLCDLAEVRMWLRRQETKPLSVCFRWGERVDKQHERLVVALWGHPHASFPQDKQPSNGSRLWIIPESKCQGFNHNAVWSIHAMTHLSQHRIQQNTPPYAVTDIQLISFACGWSEVPHQSFNFDTIETRCSVVSSNSPFLQPVSEAVHIGEGEMG